jgi:hypothetical protein
VLSLTFAAHIYSSTSKGAGLSTGPVPEELLGGTIPVLSDLLATIQIHDVHDNEVSNSRT